MTELASKSIALKDIVERVGWYLASPVRMMTTTVDYLDEVLNNDVQLVDVTNPFTTLLGCSATFAALAINESAINARRNQLGLSRTAEELYRHMTQQEFLDRFAKPGSTQVTWMVELNSLINALLPDQNGQWKLVLPRDTYYEIDSVILTHEYPIVFSRPPGGDLLIQTDVSIVSPLTLPREPLIPYTFRKDNDGVTWITFSLPVVQATLSSYTYTIQKEARFIKKIPLANSFVHARVYLQPTVGVWEEILTTHSDEVFDEETPTALLQVTPTGVTVEIPQIYIENNTVQGPVRIDVWETLGDFTIDFTRYSLDALKTTLRAIDSQRDGGEFTQNWKNVNRTVYIAGSLTPGRSARSFDDIKQRLISYARGERTLPITQTQVEALDTPENFTLSLEVDVFETRLFRACKDIPSVSDLLGQTASVNRVGTGVLSWSAKVSDLSALRNFYLLPSNTLFSYQNGTLLRWSDTQTAEFNARTSADKVAFLNTHTVFWLPFSLVIEATEQTLRPRWYHLEQPEVSNLGFVTQNASLGITVYTNKFSILRKGNDYYLTVTTQSSSVYRNLADSEVGAQLLLTHAETGAIGTLNATLLSREEDTDERIFEWVISINPVVQNDRINAAVYVGDDEVSDFPLRLASDVQILYLTSSQNTDFEPSDMDLLINRGIVDDDVVAISQSVISMTLGWNLAYLWDNLRITQHPPAYQVAAVDIPATYPRDVYETDPVTGSIVTINAQNEAVYTLLHVQGSPVLDDQGEPVYRARVGEVLLAEDGNPIPTTVAQTGISVDLFLLDAKLRYVENSLAVDYRDRLLSTLRSWTTAALETVEDQLLENTRVLYYPPVNLGDVSVTLQNQRVSAIPAGQRLTVFYFTDPQFPVSGDVQETIKTQTRLYLDLAFLQQKLVISVLETDIRTLAGSLVKGVRILGLGGEEALSRVSLINPKHRLSLDKTLYVASDRTIDWEEAVTYVFEAL